MKNQYHILNGDSLKEQFPETIQGALIVARECLVDGNVEGATLEEIFQTRAHFISHNYEGYAERDYYDKTVSEFKKIEVISPDAEINLWFEDDLFCQVNLWFTINLIKKYGRNNPIFLVRPTKHNRYGFGGLNKPELQSIFKNRSLLTEIDQLSNLWKFYQSKEIKHLLNTARNLENKYSFIISAVNAHLDRIPANGNLGRPSQSLHQIMQDLKTKEFDLVFREFCKRESIYGFGDLQVKRLMDELIKPKDQFD